MAIKDTTVLAAPGPNHPGPDQSSPKQGAEDSYIRLSGQVCLNTASPFKTRLAMGSPRGAATMKTPIPGSPHPILKPPRLLINTSTPKSKGGKPGTLNPHKIILESGSKETQMEIPPPTPISRKRGRPTSPSSP